MEREGDGDRDDTAAAPITVGERQAHPSIPFLCPATRACHSPNAIQREVIRRVELHLLHLLHSLTTTAGTDENIKGMKERETHSQGRPDGPSHSFFQSGKRGNGGSGGGGGGGCRTSLQRLRNELLVLRLLYGNIHANVIATQRDVYYHLVRELPEQAAVNAAIQRLVGQLQVPRQVLGVVAGARGNVAGALSYRGVSLLPARAGDEGGGGDGMPIPSLEEDLRVQPRRATPPAPRGGEREPEAEEGWPFTIHSNTCFILVVEKHAVFHRLMEEGLPLKVPCVLLTSHGFPTHAARLLLHHLHTAAPQLPVVGLVDYNPSGLAILLQYKLGSRRPTGGHSSAEAPTSPPACTGARRGMLESRYSCVPELAWLGLRGCHIALSCPQTERPRGRSRTAPAATQAGSSIALRQLPEGLPWQPFTSRDMALMRNLQSQCEALRSSLATAQEPTSAVAGGRTAEEESAERWSAEAALMAEACVKVEIEAMYTRGILWHDPSTPSATTQQQRQTAQSQHRPVAFGQWVCQRLLKHDYI